MEEDEDVSTILVLLGVDKFASIVVVDVCSETITLEFVGISDCELFIETEVVEVTSVNELGAFDDGLVVLVVRDDEEVVFTGVEVVGVTGSTVVVFNLDAYAVTV